MPEHELQSVKLEVGLLKNEVEVRGKQIETLLQKLDLTTDKLQQLTVQIIKLNTRQEDYLRNSSNMTDEFKILHTRIGDLHDKQLAANKEIEDRLDRLDQYKSKLMGMIIVVGGVVGTIIIPINLDLYWSKRSSRSSISLFAANCLPGRSPIHV
jgi:chromosome segregation ATPase